ncbi:cold shock domain-containing protein [Herpetosiphon giganteus]|uniref:cold shock domain-containing protein n=1 Tax=Herpetosiphon giganteus TaxID=2029754 RepID=UPI001958F7C5|nr:cold shock domain-containing protein [Herpetosiphon giganteus]MBM7846495.1 cold shock CspA family protein [Herpetosiphon giganteus]
MNNTSEWKKGIILWFNLGKGMGVIRSDIFDEDDIRFDVSDIDDDIEILTSGLPVEYIAEQSLIGMCAVEIRIIKSDSQEVL